MARQDLSAFTKIHEAVRHSQSQQLQMFQSDLKLAQILCRALVMDVDTSMMVFHCFAGTDTAFILQKVLNLDSTVQKTVLGTSRVQFQGTRAMFFPSISLCSLSSGCLTAEPFTLILSKD